MGIGSFEGENDNERRVEILEFLDFYDDGGPHKGEWNFGAFCVACEMLDARLNDVVGDEVYAIPAVGRAIISQALRVKMGDWKDDNFWHPHRQRFAAWLAAEPRRKSKHFLIMARLESYKFKDGVYGRS
jgi:hypothetical protein